MSRISTAYHEAGHAVFAHFSGGRVLWLDVRAGKRGRGGQVLYLGMPDHLKDASSLAGPVAEFAHLIGRVPSNADLKMLVEVERHRFERTRAPRSDFLRVGFETAAVLRSARRALRVLGKHWSAVEAVRKAAVRAPTGRLTASEVAELIGRPDTTKGTKGAQSVRPARA